MNQRLFTPSPLISLWRVVSGEKPRVSGREEGPCSMPARGSSRARILAAQPCSQTESWSQSFDTSHRPGVRLPRGVAVSNARCPLERRDVLDHHVLHSNCIQWSPGCPFEPPTPRPGPGTGQAGAPAPRLGRKGNGPGQVAQPGGALSRGQEGRGFDPWLGARASAVNPQLGQKTRRWVLRLRIFTSE